LKPLRETIEGADPDEQFGSALLRHVGPLEPSAARKRRVWNALEARARARTRWLRPVVAGGVILGLCTGASAMVGRYWTRPRTTEPMLDAAPAVQLPLPRVEVPRRAAPSDTAAPRSLDPPPAVPAEAIAAPVTELPPHAPGRALSADKSPHAQQRAVIPGAPAPSSLAAVLMVEAMQARRGGELARAGELASEYRRRYPEGALKEEALALSLEVAAARSDGEAARLAEQYLQQFPRGRFRSQAERALHAIRR
jgi:hypothetical protein